METQVSLTERDRKAWALYPVGTMVMTTKYHDPLEVRGYIRTKTFRGVARHEPMLVVELDADSTLDVGLHSVIGLAPPVTAEERVAVAV